MFWFGRFDVKRKMVHVEEANAGIATARLDDKEMSHFSCRNRLRLNGAATI